MVEENLNVGFTNINVSYVNGILKCEFSRAKSMPNVKNYFDIDKLYYLLFAHGELDSAGKNIDINKA